MENLTTQIWQILIIASAISLILGVNYRLCFISF